MGSPTTKIREGVVGKLGNAMKEVLHGPSSGERDPPFGVFAKSRGTCLGVP